MVDLKDAVFLRETAELIGGDLACTPDDPLMIRTRKEKGQLIYKLNRMARDWSSTDKRFTRLFILAQRLEGARKEIGAHKFGIQERRQWRNDLLDLADNLDGSLPWRFQILRHPDHPTAVILYDTETGRKTETLISKMGTVKSVLTGLFGKGTQ